MNWLTETVFGKFIQALAVSMVPVAELRVGLQAYTGSNEVMIPVETLESIGEDMGFSRRSVYNRHSKAVSRVQKLLDSRKKTGDAVCA